MVRFLPPGGPLEYPNQTRSTAKEGSEDEVKFLVCSRSPPKPRSRSGTGTALSFADKSSSIVFQHLMPLLQVCALVQAGGNLEAFDPPKLHTRYNWPGSSSGWTPGFQSDDRDLSAPSGGGNAGGNSMQKDVLMTWVLGATSLLKSLGDISSNED